MLAEIASRMDADAVAGDVIALCRAEAGAGDVPESALGELAQVAALNVGRFRDALVAGRPASADDLEPYRESARRWAALERPLDVLLRAYRLGSERAWKALVATTSPEERASLAPSVGLVMKWIDGVSSAVTEAYHEERRQLTAAEERLAHALFDRLLEGAPADSAASALAGRLDVPLGERYVPFGVSTVDAPPRADGRIAAALRRRRVLAVPLGDLVAGVVPDDAELEPVVQAGTLVALGEPVPPARVRAALADLRLVLDVARRRGLTGAVRADSCLPELLLSRAPDLAAAVRHRGLSALEEYSARRSLDLLDTLAAFVESDLDRRRAAERLHVHPNTLDYRLRRIEELTDLRFASPDDLVLMTLALKGRMLGSSRAPA